MEKKDKKQLEILYLKERCFYIEKDIEQLEKDIQNHPELSSLGLIAIDMRIEDLKLKKEKIEECINKNDNK